MANFGFIQKDFSIDVYMHVLFLFLKTDVTYVIKPEALINSNIIQNKHFSAYRDKLEAQETCLKLKNKFHDLLEKIFENIEAYKAFLRISSLLAYCVPSSAKLIPSYEKCRCKVALFLIGKHEIFDEEHSLVIAFNNLEKDFNKFCLEACEQIIDTVAREKRLEGLISNEELDFENTLSMKLSKHTSKNLSKLFDDKSISRIYSINSNLDKTHISSLVKDERVIIQFLKEIIENAGEGECEIDADTNEILNNLFEIFDEKFNKNNSFSLKDGEKLSEISIYSIKSEEQDNLMNFTGKKEVFGLLNKFMECKENNKVKVLKWDSLTENRGKNLSTVDVREHSIISKKDSCLKFVMSSRENKRGRLYSQNKIRTYNNSDISSVSSNLISAIPKAKKDSSDSVKTRSLLSAAKQSGTMSSQIRVGSDNTAQNGDSSKSLMRHFGRLKERKLSLFD